MCATSKLGPISEKLSLLNCFNNCWKSFNNCWKSFKFQRLLKKFQQLLLKHFSTFNKRGQKWGYLKRPCFYCRFLCNVLNVTFKKQRLVPQHTQNNNVSTLSYWNYRSNIISTNPTRPPPHLNHHLISKQEQSHHRRTRTYQKVYDFRNKVHCSHYLKRVS